MQYHLLATLIFITGWVSNAVADWHKRIALFMPVCFLSPDDNTALPTSDKTYIFQHHDHLRYESVFWCCSLSLPSTFMVEEVVIMTMIRKPRTRQCALDPMPTWLLKIVCDTLVPVKSEHYQIIVHWHPVCASFSHKGCRPGPAVYPLCHATKITVIIPMAKIKQLVHCYYTCCPCSSCRQHHGPVTDSQSITKLAKAEFVGYHFLLLHLHKQMSEVLPLRLLALCQWPVVRGIILFS